MATRCSGGCIEPRVTGRFRGDAGTAAHGGAGAVKRIALLAVPLLGLGGLGAWVAATGGVAGPSPVNSAPEMATVRRLDLGAGVLATGVVRPQVGAEVAVGSRVSGVLARLHATVGDRVRAGALLAELDPAELEARAERAAAALESARVERDFARRRYERTEALARTQVIARAELEDAERAYRAADARVREADAAHRDADIQLGFTRIRAPISGVVASVSTQVGETVAASFAAPTFLTVIDLDRLEVWAYVDETDIGRVEVGLPATFTVDAYPAEEFPATVTAIRPGAEVRNGVVNYITVLEIGDLDGRTLRPEMTATVTIRLDAGADVLAVPNAAVREDAGGTYALVPGPRGPERRALHTGIRGRTHTEVVAGLAEGERVLLDAGGANR